MPQQVPLQAGDPRRVGRYRLTSRLDGIPSEDPIFTGFGPDGAEVSVTVLGGYWDAAALDRFAAEAAVAKRVPPFCAARVLDSGLDGDVAYLVSEYVPGRSLLELVAEYGVATGPQLEALAIGMATGLASVHQAGLVHGSFGPQYVVLAAEGPPRVVEFGITPPYGSATPSADMLGWARTVVFAATGRPPGDSADLRVLPENLRELVQQCLELDATERPAARAIVQFLLGDRALPAGVLAEGSRRARGAGWTAVQADPAQLRDGTGPHSARHPAAPNRPRPDAAGRSAASSHQQRTPLSGSFRHPAGGASPASPGPAQRRAAGARSGNRSRLFTWLIGGAAVVLVLIVLLIVHLAQSGNPPASANTTPPGSSSRPAASQAPVIPSAFDGTWSGSVSQSVETFNVTVKLSAGQSSGTISYNGGGNVCTGGLTPTSASSTEMIMKIGTAQAGCASSAGTVTMVLSRANALTFTMGAASGTLTHS